LIRLYFDGASAGDPGPSGGGIFIVDDTGHVTTKSIHLGQLSNHEAEFHTLIYALKLSLKQGHKHIIVYTDSELVERAVNKAYAKNPVYAPLLDEVLQLSAKYDLFFIKWIPSKQNQKADQLARQGINQAD
jgi:ribonuclease HI